ncbi:MAG: exodeoxyribonuclease VII small subunit [Chloroflexaceae bacterium]|nr:exodeoxyribonuclease VII small subunit [Chloroflexaceae bacterium]
MTPQREPWNYEATVARLEDIIEQIETGSLPLQATFEQFAIAVRLLAQCEEFLDRGKERMNLLIETLESDSSC